MPGNVHLLYIQHLAQGLNFWPRSDMYYDRKTMPGAPRALTKLYLKYVQAHMMQY